MGRCVLAGIECPQTADPSAKRWCPAWWETTWTNEVGEVRLRKGCAWSQLPQYLDAFAKASAQAKVASVEAREAATEVGGNLNRGFRAIALSLFKGGGHAQAAVGLSADSGPALLEGLRDHGAPDVPPDLRRVQQSR